MINRKHVFDDLSAYLDHELRPADVRRVEAHLRTCAECRRELETLRYTIQMVQAMPAVRAPRSFTLSDAQAARVRPNRTGGWLVNALRGMTLVATLLLIAVCGFDFTTLSRLDNGRAAPAPAVLSTQNQSTAQDNASPATETSKSAPPGAGGPTNTQPVVPAAATAIAQPTTAPAAPAGAGVQPNPTAVVAQPFITAASATPANTSNAPVPPALPQNTATADPTPPRPVVGSALVSPTPDATAAAGSARSSVAPTDTVTNAPTARPTPTATATPVPPTATPKPTLAPTATATSVLPVAQAQAQPPAPTVTPAARDTYADLLPPQRIAELVLVGIVALGGISLFSLRMFAR